MFVKSQVSIFCDPGSEIRQEDGYFIFPPFYGVLDGVSGIYHPDTGPQVFKGQSGAEVVVKMICRTFFNALPEEDLESLVKRANQSVRGFAATNGIPFTADFLPASAFVVVKVGGQSIEILQGGDCLAIWETLNGTAGATPNQMYAYEKADVTIVARLMEKHHGSRAKMWEEYLPIFAARKMLHIIQQGGMALINGQENMSLCWQKFILPRDQVSRLILFSDGFVMQDATENEQALAEQVFKLYHAKGLSGIMADTRLAEELKKNLSHVDHREATCLAIEIY